MTDEQARRSIGKALLLAFAARPDVPPELSELLARIDAPVPTQAPRQQEVTSCD